MRSRERCWQLGLNEHLASGLLGTVPISGTELRSVARVEESLSALRERFPSDHRGRSRVIFWDTSGPRSASISRRAFGATRQLLLGTPAYSSSGRGSRRIGKIGGPPGANSSLSSTSKPWRW